MPSYAAIHGGAANPVRHALFDSETYASVLVTILIDTFGTEALGWAPETIQMELEEHFGVQLPKLNFDKLMAAVSVLTSDDFYQRVDRFIQLCNVFSGTEFMPGTFDPADAAECAWGMTEAMLLSPPENDEPYSDDIRYYLGKVLDDEGIRTPPDLLKIAIRETPSGMTDFSDMPDDPLMFGAMFKVNQDRTTEIENMVRENLQELFEQLALLKLQHGDTEKLLKKLPTQFRS